MPAARIRTIDALRGLMLVIMTVDHLDNGGPVHRYTFQTFGFLSAVEGFVLLSGLVAGLVYSRYAGQPGLLAAKVRSRLLLLWSYNTVMALVVLAERWAGLHAGTDGGLTIAVWAWLGSVILLNREAPLDILPMYLVFVALLPLILAGLRRGHERFVLLVSALIWGVGQVLANLDWYPVTVTFRVGAGPVTWLPGFFCWFSWQFLFVLGVWSGRRVALGDRRLTARAPRWCLGLAVAVLGILFAYRHGLGVDQLSGSRVEVSRANLGVLRLISIATVAWVFGQWFCWCRAPRPWPWLELLGRHALLVFAWQSLLVVVLKPVYTCVLDQHGLLVAGPILVLAVGSLTLLAPAMETWRDRRRRLRTGAA